MVQAAILKAADGFSFSAFCGSRRLQVLVLPGPEECSDSVRVTARLSGISTQSRATRVLVVEDERHIARLLEFVLRRAGYALRICHSAEDALIEMSSFTPDALVLDLILPGMCGIDLLRMIRAAPYCCTGAVIVLSSHWLDRADESLKEAGATVHCSKPIAPSSLLRKLEELGVHPSTPLEN
jgi:CheY-like chemotaxis protein